MSWAWWDWPLTQLTNHRPSVLWHCWLDHMTRKTVSEMTYNVLSGTINSTIPYQCPHPRHCFPHSISHLHQQAEPQHHLPISVTVRVEQTYTLFESLHPTTAYDVCSVQSKLFGNIILLSGTQRIRHLVHCSISGCFLWFLYVVCVWYFTACVPCASGIEVIDFSTQVMWMPVCDLSVNKILWHCGLHVCTAHKLQYMA